MEFRNLVTFLKVAELKNFSKAAEKLGYSQSNVSLQIQQLERELGISLFERTGKAVHITKQGQEFVFYANEILRVANKAISSVKSQDIQYEKELSGTLRIGSIESISTAILPDLLSEFHSLYPKIKIMVSTAAKDQLIEKIYNNSIDLFFTLENKIHVPSLKREMLKKEQIVFVASAKAQAFQQSSLALTDIIDMPFVLEERGESYRCELDRLLAEYDKDISPIIEIGNTETIVHLVENGIGCSFLPLFCVQKAIAKGTICQLKIGMPEISMYHQLFYHKNKWMNPQMQAFLSVARECFHQMDPDLEVSPA